MQWQPQKEIDPLKLEELKDESEPVYPFYGQATTDNGIISYNQLTKDVLNNSDGKPTILIHSNNQNIVFLETPFYLKDGHGATSVLQCDNLNPVNQKFIIACIDKVIKSKYSYNNKATKIELKNTVISLPVKNDSVDFDFMESFIIELETDRIYKLENYLSEIGFLDCTLATYEKEALDNYENGNIKLQEFKIDDLFTIDTYKKRFDANKVNISDKGEPYVVRTSQNNGVRGYIDEDKQFLNPGNTISFGQDTATVYYQEQPYFTGDKIKIVKSKDSFFNRKNAFYFIASMTKSFSSFSWGGSSFSVKIIKEQTVKIPVKDGKPDYETMESIVSAIHKLVIKDVVLYADRKIEATKKVTNK